MKKLFTLLFAVAASVGTMFAWDYEHVQIGDLYYNLDATNQTAEVTSQNSSNPYWSTTITTAIIPASVEYNSVTYTVTSIGSYAFGYCRGSISVTIPNSVTNIGEYAFSNSHGLTSVTIPNSVTSIGENAFYNCTGLTSVKIGSSVASIGGGAFSSCSSLTSINVDANNSDYCSIDGVLFNKNKTTLMRYPEGKQGAYSIPNSVTNIGDYAFSGCSGLTSVTIPNSVTSIGKWAFSGCSGLTSVTIPNSVTSIGRAFFRSGLTSPVYNAHVFAYMPASYSGAYTIPNGIESIAGGAFEDCSGLTSVTIPNSVTSIGELAFFSCTGLTSVTIPNNVSTIGARAFENCYKLESVTIPQNVTSLGVTAFSNCDSLTTIIWNAVNCTIQGSNHSPFYNQEEKGNNKITSFIVGDSVEHLPAHLCYNMRKLNSINIPSSIKSIEPDAFYGTKLLAVHISDIAAWCRINFMSGKTANPLYYAHHLYLNGEEITNLVIPDGVTEISNRAFVGYSTMESISIPNTVVRIGHTAFDGCTGLTSVVIPDGVTEIGNQAFMRCSNLQSVVLGDNVTTIGDGVFTECTSLKSPIYNRHTFLCMPTSYSGAYIIPDGIENVIGSAFYQCKELTSINIPNSVTSLGEAAFRECTKLEEVTIGAGVTALGKNVFNKCANIKKVKWNAINYRQQKPNTDSNCFPFYASRDSITSFIFGDSVEYIPVYLLKDFSSIRSLVLPASVTEIGEYAFTNDSLAEITCLSETPPTIDSTAIAGVNTSTCVLYVPYTSVNAYRNAEVWKEFVNIRAIGAEEVEEPEDDIVITPSNTTASIIWALISNAVSYELVIRDMNGNVICTLTFNALGQLTGIAFAPSRNRQAQQTQAAGFQFTVSGLENGTTYGFEFNAKDENDNIIETFTGTFTTTNDTPTSIENTPENMLNVPEKVIYNDQIYILRGDKTYTLTGVEVK